MNSGIPSIDSLKQPAGDSICSASFDSLLTMQQAADILPRIGSRRFSACTVWRWCRRGIYGVYLEHVRMGRVILTSKPALDKFFVEVAKSQRPLPDTNQSRDQIRL